MRALLRIEELLDARTRELRRSKESHRRLSEDLPARFVSFLPDGTLVHVNRECAKQVGSTPEALLGRSIWELLSPPERAEVEEVLARLSPERPVRALEAAHVAPDGSTRVVLDQIQNSVIVTDLDGNITYANGASVRAVGYARDELIGATTEVLGEAPNGERPSGAPSRRR